VQAKLQHYFPQGLQQRYAGPWANFVVAGTPQDAVRYYQALIDAGIQYFVVQMLDTADSQTIRLLAEQGYCPTRWWIIGTFVPLCMD
jgi:alkanesulfonate monooxygenase SsuD/methylene tetrahydromethanopterin reductase-like flavin-dependent oxidoreductase (luciferase family)